MRWPEHHTQILIDNYRSKGWEFCRNEIYAKYQALYSKAAVQIKACKLNLQIPEGWHTLDKAMEKTGKSRMSISKLIKRKEWNYRIVNDIWQIDDQTLQNLVDHFAKNPGWITMTQAADCMGIEVNAIHCAVKSGYLKSDKRGKYVYVQKSDIDLAIRFLEQTGLTNTPWKELKRLRESI